MRGVAWFALAFVANTHNTLAEEPPASAHQATTVVTVRGAPRALAPASLTLPAEKAAEGAGTQGDPVKALQSLPGLGRGGPGADFIAWGSEPRESRLEVDGVEIPRLYHGSGVRSVVQPSLIESLSVAPGAFGAAHGRATGGLLQLRTQRLSLDATRFGASADSLDAAAVASAPFVPGRGAALGAVRYGYVDRWLPGLIQPELRGLYQVPGYWDASAAVELALRPNESARLVGLTSSDHASFAVESQDPSRTRRSDTTARFGRLYLVYRSRPDDDTAAEVTPFVGWDESEQQDLVAGRSSELAVHALRYGLRAQHRSRMAQSSALTFGIDAAGAFTKVGRQGSLSVPHREGDPYPFGTPPGAGFARDDFRTHVLGAASWAELELRLGAFTLAPAIRLEPTLIEASRARPPLGGLPDTGTSRVELLAEPRASAEARLSRNVRLFAAGGLYHQPPDPADLGARFGNPLLGVSKATHLAVGESANLRTRTRVELTVFSKWLSDLPVRAPDPTPGLAQALVSAGKGRVFGAQLFVRQTEVHGISGWLSATLSRSERESPGHGYRLSDYDAPLVLALVVQKVWGHWRFGARGRYAIGLPRTPVVGAFYALATNAYQPELGPTNSIRLKNFAELDMRLDRNFSVGEGTRLAVYVDLLNVLGRRNQEEVVYSSDFRAFGSVSGLPPLAVLGVKVERWP
jgi:hypothetical protein